MSAPAKRRVDGVLVAWGERWAGDEAKRRRPAERATVTGLKRPARAAASRPVTADAVRENLRAFARGSPEVMVKISGGGRGLAKVAAHVAYIARDGAVALEDEAGERIEGRDEVDDLIKRWAFGRSPIPRDSAKREAIHVVLSMPAGTDRAAVVRAAREFACAAFGDNHQYVFASHDDEPHPHVHVCVKSRGLDGTRLNPRKADLAFWREAFAQACREQGLEATATGRGMRRARDATVAQSVVHLRRRRVQPGSAAAATGPEEATSAVRPDEHHVLHGLATVAAALAVSDAVDRRLAVALVERLRTANDSAAPRHKRRLLRQPLKAGRDRG